MWLSDNQTKPLVDLQEDSTPEGFSVLVNYLLPQAIPDTDEIGGPFPLLICLTLCAV